MSQATINPSRGTIRVILGTDDEGTSLSTEHLLAPWPVDDHCGNIAGVALSGMGWKVVSNYERPSEPDGYFLLDVVPDPGDATSQEAASAKQPAHGDA